MIIACARESALSRPLSGVNRLTEESALPGFFATWANVTFKPNAFFSRPTAQRSRWSPVKFALLIYAFWEPFNAVYLTFSGHRSLSLAALTAVAALAISPVIALMSVWVAAGLIHLLLTLVSGRRARFQDTFECVCYASAPLLIIAVVPIVGFAIADVWAIVVLSIALKRVHSITTPRAVFATVASPTIALALALVFRIFVFEPFKIPSGTMAPTVQAGDQIFANKFIYGFRAAKRGDVIVFTSPEDSTKDFIKRIVAIGGDTIEIRDGFLVVNGSQVPREYVETVPTEQLADETDIPAAQAFIAEKYRETLDGHSYFIYLKPGSERSSCAYERYGCGRPTRVPPGTVYVIGDNRYASRDSRSFGFIENRLIKGRANLVWWSSKANGDPRWSRIGTSIHRGDQDR